MSINKKFEFITLRLLLLTPYKEVERSLTASSGQSKQ